MATALSQTAHFSIRCSCFDKTDRTFWREHKEFVVCLAKTRNGNAGCHAIRHNSIHPRFNGVPLLIIGVTRWELFGEHPKTPCVKAYLISGGEIEVDIIIWILNRTAYTMHVVFHPIGQFASRRQYSLSPSSDEIASSELSFE